MAFIVNNDYYQYGALILATGFLVPQIKLAVSTQSLKDVSIASVVMIMISAALWGFYMYESKLYYYMIATGFVCLNSIVILLLKTSYYYKRVNEHYKSFDKPPSIPVLYNQQCENAV